VLAKSSLYHVADDRVPQLCARPVQYINDFKDAAVVAPGIAEEGVKKAPNLGNLVFLSGTSGVDPKTGEVSAGIEKQTLAALENIKLALEEASSSLNNLVKNYIFLKNVADSSRVWRTILDYFQKNAPELVEEQTVGLGNSPIRPDIQ
jgi:enamine deaminase RidA (YjgF/YER057c/UK114 family)